MVAVAWVSSVDGGCGCLFGSGMCRHWRAKMSLGSLAMGCVNIQPHICSFKYADIPTLHCLCDQAAKGGDQIVLEVWVSAGLSERSERCLANRSVGPKWPDTVQNKSGLL